MVNMSASGERCQSCNSRVAHVWALSGQTVCLLGPTNSDLSFHRSKKERENWESIYLKIVWFCCATEGMQNVFDLRYLTICLAAKTSAQVMRALKATIDWVLSYSVCRSVQKCVVLCTVCSHLIPIVNLFGIHSQSEPKPAHNPHKHQTIIFHGSLFKNSRRQEHRQSLSYSEPGVQNRLTYSDIRLSSSESIVTDVTNCVQLSHYSIANSLIDKRESQLLFSTFVFIIF